MRYDSHPDPLTGVLIASVILLLWVVSLGALLWVDIGQHNLLWVLPAVLGRIYIQTGLFILAHDAIHGVVIPSDRRLDQGVGRLAVTLYALLPYEKLALNHWKHHRYPGQAKDPDFHNGTDRSFFFWYWKFMDGYINGREKVVMLFKIAAIVLVASVGFHIVFANLFLFWLLPIALSSMQLFFFGTYLPHGSETAGCDHHAVSSNYPLLLSLLTCYHFGYHWEHHEYPDLPWYNLPSVRQHQ
ncbi:fatty acid desaturase [Nodosilinea sp. P-1105]|uniref:fatty acid desaturase n=1 Tax=Nodosilinea sp. P-1105 TaxID=2546229 RepID=UPI001F0E4CE7|nr:fatty acid desaturase [Nodosilinea sp. P-1105]